MAVGNKTDAPKPHGARYPWDEWLSTPGSVTLVRGTHFHAQPHGMAQTVRRAAHDRGIAVSVEVHEDHIVVTVHRGQRK